MGKIGNETRLCDRCGASFVWTAGEQAFYEKRGLPDPPRRCGPCRKARKEERRRPPREPRLPSCSWCGSPARVPFTVATHRPVACEACYRWRLGVGSSPGYVVRR